MGKVLASIDSGLMAWLDRQHLFFVATAPAEGHVNLSPKGYDTFRVLDPLTVAYLDLTGSGIETVSHVRENGRITFMFCAFEGPPKIVRLYGSAEVHEQGSARFDELAPRFPVLPGRRAVIEARLDRIADSCGYSVPKLVYEGEREALNASMRRRDDDALAAYHRAKNAVSIDGLPGLPGAGPGPVEAAS